MIKNILFCLLAIVAMQVKGQGVEEAIRHATHGLGGSTRTLGFANAAGAVGGSATAALINPANAALNRKSELHFGFNINSNATNSTYINSPEIADQNTGIGLSNINLTIFQPMRDEGGRMVTKGLTNLVYSFGYSRTTDYRSSFLFRSDNKANSFTDFLAEQANGVPFDQLDIFGLPYLGFETYLIEPKSAFGDSFASAIRSFNTNVNQVGNVTRTGSGGDFNFSLAADIENTFYLGGGMVVRRGRFRETLSFSETDNQPLSDTNDFAGLTYNRYLETRVTGVGLNLGAMLKASPNLRIGVSYVSPIRVRATDEYTQSLTGRFDRNRDVSIPSTEITRTTPDDNFDGFQDTLQYKYRLVTPGRLTLSAAYVFDKLGFLSIDLERVNTATAGLAPRNDVYLFTDENIQIKESYKPVFNVRIGGELTYGKYRFRAGYALMPSTVKTNSAAQTAQFNQNFYTAGIGYYEKNYSLSAALMLTSSNVNYQVYDLQLASSPQPVQVKNNFFTFQFGATVVVD